MLANTISQRLQREQKMDDMTAPVADAAKPAKPVVQIKDWAIATICDYECLFGRTLDHPRLGECEVRTSPIVRKDIAGGEVETRNTLYKLIGPSISRGAGQ